MTSQRRHTETDPRPLLGNSQLPVNALTRYVSGELRRLAMSYQRLVGPNGTCDVRRYGAAGHVLSEIPMVLFDHPDLVEDPSGFFETAITDGSVIYINAYYMHALLEADAASDGLEMSALGLLIHEASHIARGHLHGRCAGLAPKHVLALVFDACINASNLTAWPHLNGSKVRDWIATTPQAIRYFAAIHEERAVREYMEDPAAFCLLAGCPEQWAAAPENTRAGGHYVDSAALARHLEARGLHSLLQLLDLPSSTDSRSHQRLRREMSARLARAAEAAGRDAEELRRTGARHAGRHLTEAFSEQIALLHQPRLDFRLAIRQIIAPGVGRLRFDLSDTDPDPVRYSPPDGTGFATSPYIPGYTPVVSPPSMVLVILDTSSSHTQQELSECLAEIHGLARRRMAGAPEVILHFADSAVRGDPIRLSPGSSCEAPNWGSRAAVTVHGRGGTDLAAVVHDVIGRYPRELRQRRVSALLYFTDLGDVAPLRTSLPALLPPMVFVCPASAYNVAFAASVQAYADVVAISERAVHL